jgi:trimeric autotransporter adhesin
VNGDTVSLNTNGYAANFASAAVGNGIAVTVSGLTLSGPGAANYTLAQPTGLTANITSATPPSLQILASKPNIVISWTTNATAYVLNKTASLARPVTWTPATNSITVNGTNNTVTVNASSGVQFFELIETP